MQDRVTVSPQKVRVSSQKPYFDLCLHHNNNGVVPRHCDIVSLAIRNPPEYLQSVDLVIGHSIITTFLRDDFIDGDNLLPKEGLYTSMSIFQSTNLHFKYNIIDENIEVEVPEIRLVVADGGSPYKRENPSISFWETILVDPSTPTGKNDIIFLMSYYRLHRLNYKSIEDAIQQGKPFYGKVQSQLRYYSGLCGKTKSPFWHKP